MRSITQNRCAQATFLLSTLAASILVANQGKAQTRIPDVDTSINNTAYADYDGINGTQQTISSNSVSINVTALYTIDLTPSPLQRVEAGTRVLWSTVLTNNSNASVKVSFETLVLNGLTDIKLYYDSNQNGEFDSNDQLVTPGLPLTAGQQVGLWVVATTSSALSDKQLLTLPLRAHIAEDANVTAQTDLAVEVALPQVVARQTVDRTSIDPTTTKDFDLHYNLELSNTSPFALQPTLVTIDGQKRSMVLMVNPIPANTQFKAITPANLNAVVLYRIGLNSYTTKPPSDLSSINEIIVAYPTIRGSQTERIALTLTVNSNVTQTTITNQFYIQYDNNAGEQKTTNANIVQTVVGGRPTVAATSSNFLSAINTSPVNLPLALQAKATACNINRTTVDQVKLRIKSVSTGDIVEVIATETAPNSGIYQYSLPTTNSTTANGKDQTLQTVRRDSVEVSLTDCLDSSGQSTKTISDVTYQVAIDPYGIVFDAKTGLPVPGATVILLDANDQPVGDNVISTIDPMTGATKYVPAKQITNAAGEFSYPYVLPGKYRVKVDTSTISGDTQYTFSSDKTRFPISQFGSDKLVDEIKSYGNVFTVQHSNNNPKLGNAVDNTKSPPHLNFDIPIDPKLAGNSSLFVKKVASSPTAEVGDFEDYTVTVANRGNQTANDVSITDTLPRGFTYTVGSMRVNGVKVADPAGGKGPYLTLGLGNLNANSEVQVQYRVQVGPNALNGDGINRVRAKDKSGQNSNEASAKVDVRPGALIQDGFIVGKVFVDCNDNGMQDNGEQGVPGVRLYLEDGSFVVTDHEGKYDFYGISAKTHVLKLDRTTMPGQGKLSRISNRQASDAGSRFVDLRRGELHRADFAIVDLNEDDNEICDQALLEEVAKRKAKIEHDNIDLEKAIRSDLTTDPFNATVSDVRGQPANGCISTEGVVSNCNVELDNTQQQALHVLQIEPVPAVKTINLEQALEEAEDQRLQILNLVDSQILPINQATVQLKGLAGTQIQLWVNGEQVPDSRIGKKAVLADFQVAGFDYIGVPLRVGKNTIEARQLDMMGNIRATQAITVIAPDNMSKISIDSPKQDVAANGSDVYQAVVKVVDQHGTPVASRTPLTLNSTIGRIQLKDLNPEQPGIQVFVEGGSLVVPIQSPTEPGQGALEVESGSYHNTQQIRFLPDLRPLIASGIVEGRINLTDFDPKKLSKVDSRDGFEEELHELSSSRDGKLTTHGRAALFLKGKVKGEYLLTLSYDSDKSKGQRLFRDIRPDEYYPVYGDAAAKGFDAQSTSKLYVRVDKGRSYAMYGDYVTRTENEEGLSLGQYNRSLTGVSINAEDERSKVTAFAARTNSTQITNEQRGLGITGPYSLGNVNNDSILRNSEKVEIIVRDRDNPGLIISRQILARFTDYEIDTFSNSLFLKTPIASVDKDLNPIYLRVTTESDQGGPEYTVAGVSASTKLSNKVKVGGAYVKSNDPLTKEELASANVVVKLSPQSKLVAEIAHSSNVIDPNNTNVTLPQINASTPNATGDQSGTALRVELEHNIKNTQIRAYHQQADSEFYNTSSPITAGRKESGLKVQSRIDKVGLVKAEAIRTEDSLNHGVRDGITASVERAINRIFSLELGMRHYRETSEAASNSSVNTTPYNGTTARAKVTAQLPRGSNAFIEYEQDIADSERKVFAIGGNYQMNEKARLYARHELISSLSGTYGLNDHQERNTTVFGVDSKYSKSGTAFSEYRVRDGISAREAEAAIGLRNRWQVKDGVFINTSLEKVNVLEGKDNLSQDATSTSVGIEYLTNPDWKATARLENRWASQSDTILSTLGFAYKVNDDVTLLTKNIFSQTNSNTKTAGDRTLDRLQLGLAYRDYVENRFDALGKVEYRYEDDSTNLTSPFKREAYILSTVANYHPTQQLTLSGQYAIKHLNVNFNGLESSGIVQLVGGRAIYDINSRWDVGINAGVLWSDNSDGKRWLLGAELGYLLAKNLWVSAGYNYSGYKDDDLIDGDSTAQGPYLRLRFKFDEELFKRKKTVNTMPLGADPMNTP